MIGSVTDITERKRADDELRESENRFRQLANSLPQLIWTCQPDGPCDFLSQQWVVYTGIPEEQQLGYRWLEQLHPDDKAPAVAAWQEAAASGTNFHLEFRIRRHDGEYRWFDTQAVRLLDAEGRNVKWFGSNTDITERKQIEQKILQLNAELEQRVAERTASLEAANKELEGFSYSVSHDLRVPLRAVDGFSKLVLKRYEDKLDDEGKRLLNVVRNNTVKMGHLIDDILAFSRAGRLELKVSETDMEALARDVWQELEPSMAGREAHLDIKPLPKVQCDPAMLRQVWVNLLGNAAKFTNTRTTANIEVGALVAGNECTFYVKDNGVGFDMQYVDKLFGVFQRLHGVDEFEGTGIGLAIVKRIITRHSGRVWAEGKVDEGATFYFALPIKT